MQWGDLLFPDVLDGVDAYIDGEHTPSTRPAAINAILRDWLTSEGLIPYQEAPSGKVDPDARSSRSTSGPPLSRIRA